jgi:ABC-2 type transport system ATP-binding protein
MLTIKNLSKSFGKTQVLKKIDIDFKKGVTYGIVGKNGAGKSTLFRCIAGLEKYDGSISPSSRELKNQLGLLLSEPYFFAKITGREYIQLLCDARRQKLNNLDERNIFELPLDQYASTYSTGMKKKLALLAILIQENSYYILDEPFNGVDMQSNIIIESIIHKLKSLGKIVLMSSHVYSILCSTCDEIHLLNDGVFTDYATKEGFVMLENKMQNIIVGDRIDRLKLT